MRIGSTLAAMVLVLGMAMPAGAQNAPAKSAYEKLDNVKLAETLSSLGMTRYLSALADQLDKSSPAESQYVRAEAILAGVRLAQEHKKGFDPAEIEKAAKHLEKGIELIGKAEDPYDFLKLVRFKMRLMEARGIVAVQDGFDRLMQLQTNPDDQKKLVESTRPFVTKLVKLGTAEKLVAAGPAFDLVEEVSRKVGDWKGTPALRVTIVPVLAEIEERARYRLGMLAFSHAIGLDPNVADNRRLRNELFNEARQALDRLAKGDDLAGNKAWSLLLTGRICREMNDYSRMQETLKQLLDMPEAGALLKFNAQFETARGAADKAANDVAIALKANPNQAPADIEKKGFDAASKAADDFRVNGAKLVPPASKWYVDLQYALLRSYALDLQSQGAKADAARSADLAAQSQKALLDFAAQYPDFQAALFDMLATRYQNATGEPKTLPSIVLVSKAMKESDAGTEAGDKKAEELFSIIIARDPKTDPASKLVRPLALYQVAMLYANERQNRAREAGDKFLEVARIPDSSYFLSAAMNAARCYTAIVADLQDSGKPLEPEVCQLAIDSLKLIFDNKQYAASPEAQSLRYMLGQQYELLAQTQEDAAGRDASMRSAIAILDTVPAAQDDYYSARLLAWRVRIDLANAARTKPEKAKAAETYAKPFADFVQEAQAALKAAAARPERVAELTQIGADADYLLANMLYNLLDKKKEAADILQKLPEKWASPQTIRRAAETLIRWKLEEGDVDNAIVLLDDFIKRYPQSAGSITQQVVAKLQESINDLRYVPGQVALLTNLRKAYCKFAQDLYTKESKKPGVTEDYIYPYKQMFVGGLIEEGLALKAQVKPADTQFNQAKAMLAECMAYEAKQKNVVAAQIDKEFNAKAAALKTARAGDVEKLAGAFLVDMKERAVSSYLQARTLEAALKRYQANRAGGEIEKVRSALAEAYPIMATKLKAGVATDLLNAWAQARVNWGLGQHAAAVKGLRELARGMAVDKKHPMYWQLELEWAQCTWEGFNRDKPSMESMSIQLKNVTAEGRKMGASAAPVLPLLVELQQKAEAASK